MTMILPRDRLLGGLIGLIIGDALGVPVEFSFRGDLDYNPVRGMRGFGTHQQPLGSWSDDGSLALAHAEALIQHGWDPQKHLQGFLAWLDEARWTANGHVFDIGNTTRRAIVRFRRGTPIADVGGRGERDNGNGSLMRILPISCWCTGAETEVIVSMTGEASALTHAHIRSRLSCAFHGLIVDGILARRPIGQALAEASQRLRPFIPDEEVPHFISLLDGTCLHLPRSKVPSDGYVISTLIASCWCLHQHPIFADAVLAAVNMGGDTDTTAAVVGGLAGLRCGFTGLPRVWTTCLPHSSTLLAIGEQFAQACIANSKKMSVPLPPSP